MTPARIIAAICVVAPFVAVLWVPLYDKDKPELGGFPFFFWWQLLWVAITAGLMGLAYYVVRREEVSRKAASAVGNVADTGAAVRVPHPAEPQDAEAPEDSDATGTDTDTDTDTATEEGDAE